MIEPAAAAKGGILLHPLKGQQNRHRSGEPSFNYLDPFGPEVVKMADGSEMR
jgi:hypothetical protein